MGEFDFGPDHYKTVGTMQWNAFVSNVGGALLVTGSITGVVATISRTPAAFAMATV